MKVKFSKFSVRISIVFFCLLLCLTAFVFAQTGNERDDFGYGKKLYEDKFYDLSALQFSEFLRKYPESPLSTDALYFLSESYYNEGEFSEAKKGYLNFLISHPRSDYCAQAQYRIASCMEKEQKIESSIDSYFRTYIFYPQNPWAFKALLKGSRLAYQLKDYAKAESMLSLLIDQVDNATIRTQARLGLAEVYQAVEEYEKALKILDRIQSETQGNATRAAVHWHRGRIQEAVGHVEKSEDSYKQGLLSNPSDSLKQRLSYRLGLLQSNRFNLAEAQQYLKTASEIHSDPAIQTNSLYELGSLQLMQGQISAAIQSLTRCLEIQSDDSTRQRCMYRLADAYRLDRQFDLAEKTLRNLISEPLLQRGKTADPFLSLAALYVETGQYENAVERYLDWIDRSPDSELIPYVLFKLGSITMDQLHLVGEGLSYYQAVWQRYPGHPLVLLAKLNDASGLVSVKRFNEAIQIYQSIQTAYPGSAAAFTATDLIRHAPLVDPTIVEMYAAEMLNSAPASNNSGIQTQHNLYFARVFHYQTRAYALAIQKYKSCLNTLSDEAQTGALLFSIGEACQALYQQTGATAYRDSAVVYFQKTEESTVLSDVQNEAKYSRILLQTVNDPSGRAEQLRQYLGSVTEVNPSGEALFKLGEALSVSGESEQVIQTLKPLISRTDSSEIQQKAKLMYGQALFAQGKFGEADSILLNAENTDPKSMLMPQILYQRAGIQSRLKNIPGAIELFKTIRNRYRHSLQADSAGFSLGRLYLAEKQFAFAELLYRDLVREDSTQRSAFDFKLLPSEPHGSISNLLGLARSCEGLQRYGKAKKLYKESLYLNPTGAQKEQIYRALSRIAEQEGNTERAILYLEQISAIPGSVPISKEVGDLHFQSGQYADATAAYRTALETAASDSIRMVLTSSLIRSLLKQNQLPQAETQMQFFEKNYTKLDGFDTLLAELVYERGSAQLLNKDFALAQESFEEIKKKHKNTEYLPRAELEIGRILLITNKTEEALKLLTSLPEKYPNHAILDRVYLSLGDHYFRSNQYDNAIVSFKRVIGSNRDQTAVPLAMRYLIRVYEALQLYDAGLAITRQYLDAYPNAEDILQKKVQIGLFQMRLKEYQRATEQFRKVKVEADAETEAEIQFWIGKCYEETGQYQQAIFEYLKVKYLSQPTKLPWASTALFEAAKAYQRLNENEKARKLFQDIVRVEGATSDLGRIALQKIEEINSIQTTADEDKS